MIITRYCIHLHNCINATDLSYLQNPLTIHELCSAGLKSSSDMLRLAIPFTEHVTGESTFLALGPHLWNSLLLELRQLSSVYIFKKCLKTYLFPEFFICTLKLISSLSFNLYLFLLYFFKFFLSVLWF